jgi:hypothetical protein
MVAVPLLKERCPGYASPDIFTIGNNFSSEGKQKSKSPLEY